MELCFFAKSPKKLIQLNERNRRVVTNNSFDDLCVSAPLPPVMAESSRFFGHCNLVSQHRSDVADSTEMKFEIGGQI
jgi:hypothetical protein